MTQRRIAGCLLFRASLRQAASSPIWCKAQTRSFSQFRLVFQHFGCLVFLTTLFQSRQSNARSAAARSALQSIAGSGSGDGAGFGSGVGSDFGTAGHAARQVHGRSALECRRRAYAGV